MEGKLFETHCFAEIANVILKLTASGGEYHMNMYRSAGGLF